MREFLEDAQAHREDGYGRAQKHARRELPRRFYSKAEAGAVEGGFAVLLDGRMAKTPGGAPVIVPAEPLAALLAAEWAAQGEKIDPATMPAVRLVNSAIEGGEAAKPALRDEIIRYAGNDLLLYRADSPRELAAAQEAAWDSVLVALARAYGITFQPTIGIIHQEQPPETLRRLAEDIAQEGLFQLTALVSITGLTGSALLALALRRDMLAADAAWAAAHVDEDHNMRLWGEDAEAMARRARRRAEFDAALGVIAALR